MPLDDHADRSVSPELGRYSYRTLHAWFKSACEWLTELGVAFDNTRIQRYENDLEIITEFQESGRISELLAQRGFPQLMNSLIEAQEITVIHRGLHDSKDADLANRLKKIVKGTVLTSDESLKSNNARNIGFELLIASAFAAAGLPIDLEPPNDVWLPLQEYPVAIECKRPFSYAKVENRLRKGFNQLVARYQSHSNPSNVRGIVALSISKIENDGSKFLHAETDRDLASQVRAITDKFYDRYRRRWEAGIDRRTISVLLYLEAPAIIESRKLLVVDRQIIFVPLCNPDSPEHAFLKRISDAIGLVSPLMR